MPSVYFLRWLLVFSFFFSVTIAERKCYALNGTQLDDNYGPCNPNAKQSGCCAINRSAGSVDLCLSNGLCMATNDEYMGTIWQDGCTDPTGMDPSCPKMCPDARDNFDNGPKVFAWNVQMCDYGSYCCRAVNDHTNCCTNATAPKIKTKFLGAFQFQTSTADASSTRKPTSTAASSSSSSSPPPTSSLRQALAAATPSDTTVDPTLSTTSTRATLCAPEKRKTAIVGGALAGVFSAAVVGLLGVVFYLFRKEKKQRKLKEHYEAQFATTTWGTYGTRMGSKSTVVEMDASRSLAGKDVEVRYIGKERDP